MAEYYYVGLSGIELPNSVTELGGGMRMEVTFGHLFAPYMMAFQPAPAGKAHPAPWRAVSAGFATDIYCQLVVPGEHTDGGRHDAMDTAWLIATLLRVQVGPHIRAAVVSTSPISVEAGMRGEGEIWAMEVMPSPLLQHMTPQSRIGNSQLAWIQRCWQPAEALCKANRDFRVLLEAYSGCSWARSPSLALVELWGAMQRVFTQGHQEASLRLSTLLASYLEGPGIKRRQLAEQIGKLYGARSQGAHGGQGDDVKPLADSANIAARTIMQLIEHQAAPTRDDLFDMLYGV